MSPVVLFPLLFPLDGAGLLVQGEQPEVFADVAEDEQAVLVQDWAAALPLGLDRSGEHLLPDELAVEVQRGHGPGPEQRVDLFFVSRRGGGGETELGVPGSRLNIRLPEFHAVGGSVTSDAVQMIGRLAVLPLLVAPARAGEKDPLVRLRLRKEKAVPLLTSLRQWLLEQKEQVLPKSPIAAAINYVLNQWQALNRYTLFSSPAKTGKTTLLAPGGDKAIPDPRRGGGRREQDQRADPVDEAHPGIRFVPLDAREQAGVCVVVGRRRRCAHFKRLGKRKEWIIPA